MRAAPLGDDGIGDEGLCGTEEAAEMHARCTFLEGSGHLGHTFVVTIKFNELGQAAHGGCG